MKMIRARHLASPRLGFALAFALAAVACGGAGSAGQTSSADSVELPEQEKIAEAPATPSAGGAGSGSASQTATPAASGVTQQYRLPEWKLEDVQPKSDRFGESYGLEAYAGRTIVVVLLEGHCPYCQSNSKVAQQLQDELATEKLDVQIVVLGDRNAEQFSNRVGLPIFRDKDGSAWETMRPDASKHDTFVFGPDGKRTYFWLGSYQGDASRWRTEVGKAARDVARPLDK